MRGYAWQTQGYHHKWRDKADVSICIANSGIHHAFLVVKNQALVVVAARDSAAAASAAPPVGVSHFHHLRRTRRFCSAPWILSEPETLTYPSSRV